MAAIYFMGIKPELEDGQYPSDKRCSCHAQANVQVFVKDGDPFAYCPVCNKEYVVFVETDFEGVHLWPVAPEQII